jgi:hypothetical protein
MVRSKRKRPFGRPGRRGEDSMKMDIKHRGCDNVVWIHVPQDRNQRRAVVNTETSGSLRGGEILE